MDGVYAQHLMAAPRGMCAAPAALYPGAMSTRPIAFYFDYTSPYSYLASTEVESLAARIDAALTWHPAFLGAIMKATGNQPPAMLPTRAAYMAADLARQADHQGVPMRFSPYFPMASQHAMRATLAVQATDPVHAVAYIHALFRAAWVDGEDIGDRGVLGTLASRVGADPALAAGATDDPRWKDALRKNTEDALAVGAFGLPVVVYEAEMYFGNDRLALVEARARRGSPWSPPLTTGPVTF